MSTADAILDEESHGTASSFRTQFFAQFRSESRRLLRNFRFIFFTLAFPVLYFILMTHVFITDAGDGSAGSGGGLLGGITAFEHVLVSMTAYGVMGAGLNLFGSRLAIERGKGWMRLLRTTPLRGSSTILARWATGLVFSAVVVVVMAVVGSTQNISMPISEWLRMGAILWLGALPFGALGLALGYWLDEKSAQVVGMMVYFFLAIFGGLWWPVELMPQAMQTLAQYLPAYQYAQLARLAIAGGSSASLALWLAAYTVAFLILAWQGWRRDEGQVYR